MEHCPHKHTDYTPADSSVGQYEYLVCEDCGEDLTDTVLVEQRDAALERKADDRWEWENDHYSGEPPLAS